MKIMKVPEVIEKIMCVLLSALKDAPFLKVVRKVGRPAGKNSPRPNMLIEVEVGKSKQKTILLIEFRNRGEPRLVREAINQLHRYRQEYPDAYGVVGAPYISPASEQICIEEGVGYIDLAGNCRLVFEPVYIVRQGAKNPFAEKRDLRTLYSPRAARVLRVLLCVPAQFWKIKQLAKEADVSLGQTSNVKQLLKNREWIVEGVEGFRLEDPRRLLEEWVDNYTFRKSEAREFYSMAEMPEIESKLAVACAKWKIRFALTGLPAAARQVPGIRYSKVMAYIERIPSEIINETGLKEVTSGANVSLLVPYDSGIFYDMREYEGIPVASAVQLYLDLKGYNGRGEEAAEVVYERVLKKTW